MDTILRFIYLLMGFALVIIAAHFTTKWFGSKMGRIATGKHIRIVDRVSFNNDSFVYIVKIERIFYILGVTKAHIEVLDKIEKDELDICKSADSAMFAGIFEKYLTGNRKDIRTEKGHE